jgi:hypothetical protein
MSRRQPRIGLKVTDERFNKAKECAVNQTMELRADVKEKDRLLKETQDLAKAAGQGSEEFKQLRSGLADQKKQLQVVKSRLEAPKVARAYLKSKGL